VIFTNKATFKHKCQLPGIDIQY